MCELVFPFLLKSLPRLASFQRERKSSYCLPKKKKKFAISLRSSGVKPQLRRH